MNPNNTSKYQGKKILIIEDDAVLSGILARALGNEGVSVSTARNGNEGLETLVATTPELILLDIDMPQMDGVTMLKNLRAGGNTTPVMILTNINDPAHIADAAEHGAYEYLVKADWEIDDIVKKILAHFPQ